MKISGIRETTVSFAAAVRNAGIAYDAMTASAVVVETDIDTGSDSLIGLGLDSIGRYGHGALLRERFIPRLLAADPARLLDADGLIDPPAATGVLMANEKPGGHGERAGAVGVLDMALWDLRAKQRGEPAWKTIADYYDQPGAPEAAVYTTGGHYADDPADIGPLTDALEQGRARGHTAFKVKIGGAPQIADVRRLAAARKVVGEGALAADANAVWDAETASAWMEDLAEFNLAWLEEPVAPLDYAGLATFTGRHAIPVGVGENLFSFDDARNLRRHGGLRPDRDWLQFDISLSYGIPEYVRILSLYRDNGWSARRFAPHAGHLLGLHTVAALGLGMAEMALDDTLAIAALPQGASLSDGVVTLPDVPGFGIEATPPLAAFFEIAP